MLLPHCSGCSGSHTTLSIPEKAQRQKQKEKETQKQQVPEGSPAIRTKYPQRQRRTKRRKRRALTRCPRFHLPRCPFCNSHALTPTHPTPTVPRPTSHTATVHSPPSTTSQRATFSSQPKNPRPRTRPKTRTAPPNSHPSSAQQILELAPPPSLHLFQIQPTPALLLPFHTRARPDGKLPIAHLTYRKTSPSNSLTSFKFELIIEPVSRSSQQNRQQKHNLTRRSPGCRLFTPPPLIIL
ncbi:hypothetical protein CABS01_16006 [Colletotrichum abscissum]|uniref:uncharacterized protein n=1 Tax=Colletotrichum abscissum TaxID=1671311 RepID=UPI0027D4BEAF|nr:uncharacterized protein CABS01_16006 [Colletotrichum abscissum]KAK1474027.1 hypothetical protein CABS01_16006 [Colletotrichum abscissum]